MLGEKGGGVEFLVRVISVVDDVVLSQSANVDLVVNGGTVCEREVFEVNIVA